jgi:hypothetical protein
MNNPVAKININELILYIKMNDYGNKWNVENKFGSNALI